ncbi:solute carrier family 52, riboflavin transporter, member 3-B-like isoform X3 [Biomphalaria glabrata]|uniref:Riboflavin transporter n=1 Tax=Biomphalaria glabrata TaxID=6526 RepID=A0A9W3AXF3_BIOGL|nr:solute carrier family 52, riboflavin transporter, member 3-B-like isoform X3 [Biomphalaria glabrata]XP_055891902.1 solute carrier family 52, riboflavin transporter, member 3-B-like isoform X3 [Biomphalaria glabrata]XP_055891903.1 solute carrier family 52, riboflavin transporter, member 3-B-like isoform X3 [Biomphalaria glabrata]XP_055891904.1 solute carrier family 52, riboflavin transporter, member 3-B-like isoform X3 [Biomphalaria glabrata]
MTRLSGAIRTLIKMSQDLCRCGNVSLLVYLLVILFGVSSWVDINGLWVELPILVQHLPEGWDLPSYMAVIIQIANVAPLVYTIASALYPHRVLEVPVSYLIITLGAISCFLMAFLWDATSIIAGQLHSTALLALQFCLALVDCTSSVAFLPFMSRLKPQYMPAYFIGEGFSGLIPSLVALGQGAGSMKCVEVPSSPSGNTSVTQENTSLYFTNYSINHTGTTTAKLNQFTNLTTISSFATYPVYEEARFSVRAFFLFLMTLMICSLISFVLLNYWSYCKRESVGQGDDEEETEDSQIHVFEEDSKPVELRSKTALFINSNDYDIAQVDLISKRDSRQALKNSKSLKGKITRSKFALFLLLTVWLNALSNGVLPSIQTYACLPYGIQAYHLSINMASIANPVACIALIFLEMTSLTKTILTSVLGTVLSAYVVFTAVSSPSPPLVDHFSGSIICILSWTLLVFILTYSKVAIATVLRSKGKRGLLWVGAASQAGSLTGAFITFLLVNVYKILTVGNPCL